jgi:nitrite reductase/ring-hydroxylating ferredoxin subunit
MADFTRLGSVAEVPDGELRCYEVAGTHVAVAHVGEQLFAFADVCPEDAASLSDGELSDEGEVMCPDDASVFDVRSGEPVDGPAVDPVPTFTLRVIDGWVEVLVP